MASGISREDEGYMKNDAKQVWCGVCNGLN